MSSLTSQQLEAIQALSSGLSATAAAATLGIHRTTIHHWTRTIPEFRDTLEAAKQAHIDLSRDAMNALATPAIAILHQIIHDETAPPALRVRTALAIIKFVTTAEKSTQPKSSPTDIDAAYHAGYSAGLAALVRGTAAEPPIHHNSSLSTSQTPRNALCPCGSGDKYKRCCGKNAPPVLGRAA
jgi:hypothetical protein